MMRASSFEARSSRWGADARRGPCLGEIHEAVANETLHRVIGRLWSAHVETAARRNHLLAALLPSAFVRCSQKPLVT